MWMYEWYVGFSFTFVSSMLIILHRDESIVHTSGNMTATNLRSTLRLCLDQAPTLSRLALLVWSAPFSPETSTPVCSLRYRACCAWIVLVPMPVTSLSRNSNRWSLLRHFPSLGCLLLVSESTICFCIRLNKYLMKWLQLRVLCLGILHCVSVLLNWNFYLIHFLISVSRLWARIRVTQKVFWYQWSDSKDVQKIEK